MFGTNIRTFHNGIYLRQKTEFRIQETGFRIKARAKANTGFSSQ